MTKIIIKFKNTGGEFQNHRLNKEDAVYLKNEYEKNKKTFFNDNLNGGDSFEETIWSGSYGPSLNGLELINETENKQINFELINKKKIFFTNGEDNIKNACLDFFYITEGKVFGSYIIDLSNNGIFDPKKLTINYIEYKLEGYQEKNGTIVDNVEYDGEVCDMEIEDNGVDIYRSILGYDLIENKLEDYFILFDSEHQPDWNWNIINKIF